MSAMLTGLCDVCSKPSVVLNTCLRCSARVCQEHFSAETGMCTRCSRFGGRPWPRK